MNPQPNTDKATPGPWHLNTLETVPHTIHAHRGFVAEVSDGSMHEISADEIEANTRLIVKAVNEHEALCAVAEAAQTWLHVQRSKSSCDEGDKLSFAEQQLEVFLSRLAALRKGAE